MTKALELMQEVIVSVASGNGGTGKTSLAASFAVLAEQPLIADCDVDTADLHLVLSPRVRERHEFKSEQESVIRPNNRIACDACLSNCRYNAVCDDSSTSDGDRYSIDPISCEGCRVCVHFCPEEAMDFPERLCGEWMISETRCEPIVHTSLEVAAENSGRLVATTAPAHKGERSRSW